MRILRFLIVDEQMNTTEIEINSLQFQTMGINKTRIKKHDKKRDLNVTVTEFLDSFKENEEK